MTEFRLELAVLAQLPQQARASPLAGCSRQSTLRAEQCRTAGVRHIARKLPGRAWQPHRRFPARVRRRVVPAISRKRQFVLPLAAAAARLSAHHVTLVHALVPSPRVLQVPWPGFRSTLMVERKPGQGTCRTLGLGTKACIKVIVRTAPLFVPAAPAVWAQGPTFTDTSPVALLCPWVSV